MDAQALESSTRPAGGHLLAAISTSIVGILRHHYGRGPMRAKTYVLLSQAHVEPDITMEIFFVDDPLEGFGAVEIIEPQSGRGAKR